MNRVKSRAPKTKTASAPAAQKPTPATVFWGWLLTVGLTAALTFAVLFDPPSRKNTYLKAEDSAPVALVAGVVAIALLLVALLMVQAVSSSGARVGEVCVITVSLFVTAIGIYRALVGTGDSRGFTAGDLSWWLPMEAVIVLLLIGLAVRSDRRRRAAGPGAKRRR